MKKLLSVMIVFVLICSTLVSCGEKMGEGACEYLETRDISDRDIKYVEICVSGYGKMVVLLDATTAPQTVANFISLVESKFYNGLTFHRIRSDFMIQGGDPSADGTGGSDKEIYGEFSVNGWNNDISHKYGVISMARAFNPNSASSQFFIMHADAPHLDGQYAAFGKVTEGMDTVDEIASIPTDYNDRPKIAMRMKKVYIV